MNTLDQYRKVATEHGDCTREGDHEQANVAHDRLLRLLKDLASEGGDNELFKLYDDASPWVQLWAATHTLEISADRALAKLAELAAAKIPLVSMSAKYTISGWNEGSLSFRK